MHASEQWRNVTRTILATIAALSLPSGTAVVPADDSRFLSQDVTSFVRVQIGEEAGVFAGVISDRKVTRHRVTVMVECWSRLPEDAAGGSFDGVDQLAGIVRAGLAFANPTLKDYVADSTGATTAGGVLRFITTPDIMPVPPLDGWARRTVSTAAFWWPQHEA